VKLNQWQHVVATYDGKRMASGVHIYIDGEARETKTLFDQNNEPFQKKHTNIRVGEGGGLKFDGEISDARIYKGALTSQEAAAVSVSESIAKLADLKQRTNAQQAKLDLGYLDLAAPASIKNAFAELAKAQAEREAYDKSIPTVMTMADGANRDTYVLKRGAYDAPGEKVTAGVPEILSANPAPRNRLDLAAWITDRANPLTARVEVNRLWQSFFGMGIVKTVDDFGSQGEFPATRASRLARRRVYGNGLEREGDSKADRDERGIPPVVCRNAGVAGEGP